jgi:hypothetical protein
MADIVRVDFRNKLACFVCKKPLARIEGKVAPGYCGEACWRKDMNAQLATGRGWVAPYIPLQITRLKDLL